MASNRIEPAKQAEEGARPVGEAGTAPAKGGNPWIPLIANIVLMPAIAYALTTFVLIPKMTGGGKTEAVEESSHGESGGHGEESGKSAASAKNRITAPLGGKVLVNVAGTAGTRYLVASISLVGKTAGFKEKVEQNDLQLRDTASSILSSKTLSDVDKPGMRNVIRAELISAFNDILGKESVIDIYLTEFAVQ
jgi:flagellar FliL protein